MTHKTEEMTERGRGIARDHVVWDPLVRVVHWSVALCILLNAVIIDEDGAWHLYFGYIALGLVVVRLVWGMIGQEYARFSAFPPNPAAAIRYARGLLRGDREVHLSHNPMGALMVYNIWATIIILSGTGFMMGTTRFFGMEWVEEMHEGFFVWLVASIALHVGGVAFDTVRSHVPLVRAMINGKKRITESFISHE